MTDRFLIRIGGPITAPVAAPSHWHADAIPSTP
jgi:hypothetical protein